MHQAYGEVNLSKVLNKEDKKQHALKTRLEAINKALRDNSRKIEIDPAQHQLKDVAWVKNNLTADAKKTLALFDKMKQFARQVHKQGTFGDVKYKHKNDDQHWKNFLPRVSETGGLICLMNRAKWEELKDQLALSNPVTSFISESDFPGTFIVTDLLDDDEGMIIQDGLIQFWILPQLVRYGTYNYDNPGENTRDYVYELSHSIDTVDIYSSAYFKLKG